MAPEYCPNCGAEVPPRARACPECGACEETGWSERAEADRLGLPDDRFDYEEFVGREMGETPAPAPGPVVALVGVACAVLLAFLVMLFR